MQIASIEPRTLRAPISEGFAYSQWRYTVRETTLVEVRTTDGQSGWGEAYGPSAPVVAAIEHFLGPLAIGRDPRDTEELWRFLYARGIDYGQKGTLVAALSALDIAFWDLKAQTAGLPLYRALGASFTESIECYATGFYFPDTEPFTGRFQREAAGYLAQGFRALKMKVGLGIDRDTRLVAALRREIGPGVRLMIDANHAYTPAEAIALGRRVEEHDIHWFEEPVSPLDVQGYAEVKARLRIPLAGGECESTRFGFAPWFAARAFDYAQPDLCAAGGISEGMKIAALATLANIHVTPHVWGTAIGQAAALHFYAARPRPPFTLTAEAKLIECDRSENPLREGFVRNPIVLTRGRWSLPQTPGLGLEIDRRALDRYTVR
jgi:D-galactarolactone cycloisomerase